MIPAPSTARICRRCGGRLEPADPATFATHPPEARLAYADGTWDCFRCAGCGNEVAVGKGDDAPGTR